MHRYRIYLHDDADEQFTIDVVADSRTEARADERVVGYVSEGYHILNVVEVD
jgi:hypothetical protein